MLMKHQQKSDGPRLFSDVGANPKIAVHTTAPECIKEGGSIVQTSWIVCLHRIVGSVACQ